MYVYFSESSIYQRIPRPWRTSVCSALRFPYVWPWRAHRTGQGTRRGGGRGARGQQAGHGHSTPPAVAPRSPRGTPASAGNRGAFVSGRWGQESGKPPGRRMLCFPLPPNFWVFSLKTVYMVAMTRFPGKSNQNVPASTYVHLASGNVCLPFPSA